MILIGCDFHPSWQQVSWMNEATGEAETTVKLDARPGRSGDSFTGSFRRRRGIGMEVHGNCQWFVELLRGLGHEVWIGDAAKIRASDTRQQKHDKRDARLLAAVAGGKDGFRGSGRRQREAAGSAAVADSPATSWCACACR